MNTEAGHRHPLADFCALCGEGYHPNAEIMISDEPDESGITGEMEFRWSHMQCQLDHERIFLDNFGDKVLGDDVGES